MRGVVVADYDETKRAQIPGAAMRYCLNDERISMLNVGMSVPEDIVSNAKFIKGDVTYTDADRHLLADYAAKAYDSDYVKALKVV